MDEITAYATSPDTGMIPEPGDREREWIANTPQAFARRCLPLLMANQSGWTIQNNQRVRIRWNGKGQQSDIKIDYQGDHPFRALFSDFGSGIVTWRIPFVFRTPPGVNLLVRGPANFPKDGIAPLEGLVETDWIESTFTMNWQITRPKHWITFEAGDPICQIVPMRRDDLEAYRPRVLPLADNPDLEAGYGHFREARLDFSQKLRDRDPNTVARGWQRDYFRGRTATGTPAPEHQTRRQLHPFQEPSTTE